MREFHGTYVRTDRHIVHGCISKEGKKRTVCLENVHYLFNEQILSEYREGREEQKRNRIKKDSLCGGIEVERMGKKEKCRQHKVLVTGA